MKTSAELEQIAVAQVIALMAAAARTAPKTRGVDNIRVLAIDDDRTKHKLIAKMREIALRENRPSMARDAGNIENAPALLIIGTESNTAGLNCGFCGKSTCEDSRKCRRHLRIQLDGSRHRDFICRGAGKSTPH